MRMSFVPAPLLVAAALLATISSGYGQDLGDTVGTPGIFSYQAPKGWKVLSSPMSKYPVAMGAPHNSFAANINVVTESFPKSLADYVAANKVALAGTPLYSYFRIVDERSFVTAAGVTGVRIIANDQMGKLELQQIFYFFDGTEDTKFVVTASSILGDGPSYLPIFDASLKTFRPNGRGAIPRTAGSV